MASYFPDVRQPRVPTSFSDFELMSLARDGEAQAFEEYCRRFVAPAWQAAYAVAGHTGDAAEPGGDVEQPSDRLPQPFHHDYGEGARPLRAGAAQRIELSGPRGGAGLWDCST